MPFGRLVNASCSAAGDTVRLTGPVAVSAGFELSVACTVMFDVPAVVGVPLTVQLFGASDRPAGSVPAVMAQMYGPVPPLTPIGLLYGTPTCAPGNVPVVIVRGDTPEETVIVSGAVVV